MSKNLLVLIFLVIVGLVTWTVTGYIVYATAALVWAVVIIVLAEKSLREVLLLVALMVALVIVTINFFLSVAGSLALYGLAKVAGMDL